MRIIALIPVRNGELYVDRCLKHLHEQGIQSIVIDNDSTDRTRELAERWVGRGVLRVERLPYQGKYELLRIIANAERLVRETEADWFIHYDVDEIMESPRRGETLHDAIVRVDGMGDNVINFDEFTFFPVGDESFENQDYVAGMRHYYFFEPTPLRLQRAFKKPEGEFDMLTEAGHRLNRPDRRIHPESFIHRHYIVLSRQHAARKYLARIYSEDEFLNRRWHGTRRTVRPDVLNLPDASKLQCLPTDGVLSKAEPWRSHKFLEPVVPVELQPAANAMLQQPRTPGVLVGAFMPGLLQLQTLLGEQCGIEVDCVEGLHLQMSDIHQTRPELRFIHLVGDGRTLATADPLYHPGDARRLEHSATDWAWQMRETRQQSQQLTHYLEVRLEDLSTRPQQVIDQVCGFLEADRRRVRSWRG